MKLPSTIAPMIVCLLLLSALEKPASVQGADPIVGQWSWGGGATTQVWPNGHAHLASPAMNMEGQWTLVSRGAANRERQYVITWDSGKWINNLHLSMDHQRLYGQNQFGWGISGTRISGGGGAEEATPTTAEATRPAKERGNRTETKPVEKNVEATGEVSMVAPENGGKGHGVPRKAAVVPLPGKADSEEGNIQVTYADGFSEMWTKGGHCDKPQVSSSGDVGWDRPEKLTSDRYGRTGDLLQVRLHDGSTKTFKPNVLFIMKWDFASQDSEVIIESMAHHGASSLIKYDIKTGRVTGEVLGYHPKAEMPKWAQPYAED